MLCPHTHTPRIMCSASASEWPYADHRTMADVLLDEADGCACEMTDVDRCDECPVLALFDEQDAA